MELEAAAAASAAVVEVVSVSVSVLQLVVVVVGDDKVAASLPAETMAVPTVADAAEVATAGSSGVLVVVVAAV